MLLSILICLYFLFLPSSRNEFWSRGGTSSNFISGLLSWCSKLRPQSCLLRLRPNVDMIIAMTRVTMWMCFMANCLGKGCGWGLATTGVSALLHFIYGLIMGKFLEWVFTKSLKFFQNFWQKLNISLIVLQLVLVAKNRLHFTKVIGSVNIICLKGKFYLFSFSLSHEMIFSPSWTPLKTGLIVPLRISFCH